jgi:hypothetical protein
MTKDEKDILLEELQLLKELLDIHLQNPHFWVDDQMALRNMPMLFLTA